MRPVYIILLVLWFIASWWMCKKYYTCNKSGTTVSEAAVGAAATDGEGCITELKFEDGDFMVSTSENFRFGLNEVVHNDPTDALTDVAGKVVSYLQENEGQFMEITGYYLESEDSSDEEYNLGKLRARSVREYFKELGVEGSQITSNGEIAQGSCVENGVLQKGVSVIFDEIPSTESN